MRFCLALILALLVTLSIGARVRKEFRDMSKPEWRRFKRVFMKMDFYEWASIHNDAAMEAHNTPQLLPWHRAFLYRFEDGMRRIDPNVTIPYWDWSFDASDPVSSPIFRSEYFGIRPSRPPSPNDSASSASPEPSRCLYFRGFPEPHCLKRYYRVSDFGQFYHQDTISAIVYASGLHYDQFRVLIEVGPHGLVHVLVGGHPSADMSTMASPNDPIFWLHHAYIDYLWSQWQALNDPFAYDGVLNDVNVSLDDTLSPFESPVRDWMSLPALKYSYRPYSGWDSLVTTSERHSPSRLSDAWMSMNHIDAKLVTDTHNMLMRLLANGSHADAWPKNMTRIPSVV